MNEPQTSEAGTSVSIDGQRSNQTETGGTSQRSGATPEATSTKITEARTTSGFARSGDAITEDCIVKVNGMEGQIKSMVASGLLQRLEDGSFALPDSIPAGEDETAPSESTVESPEALSNDLEGTITEFAEGASTDDVMSIINSMATIGELNDNALGRISSRMGMEPEAARDKVNTIRAGFEAQARAAVETQGLNSDDVFAWVYENHPDMYKMAVINHATQRTTKGYQEIASKYVASMDKANPDAILNATFPEGISASKARDGKVMVHTPQGDFEWGALVKAGRVSIGGAG